MSRLFSLLAALLLCSLGADAQEAGNTPADSVFTLAQRLVAEGRADSGRALIGGVLKDAAPGSPRYVDALFLRASLAATDADAERDYRRIIIEYPLSPREEDALVGIAQLEMARGEKTQALAHLRRLLLEHPSSRSRARADFWMARVLFEDSANVAGGCTRLDDAKQVLPPDDVEFRNRIDFYAQRCAGVARKAPEPAPTQVAATTETSPAPAPPAPAPPAPAPPAPAPPAPSANPAPTTAPVARASSDSSVAPDTTGSQAGLKRSGTTSDTLVSPSRPDSVTPTVPPATAVAPQTPPQVAPSVAPPVRPPSGTQRPSATPRASSSGAAQPARHVEYSVQVAAYNSRPLADKLRSSLAARGYRARVVGSGAPFRVRVGRFPSREAALAAAQKMRAQKITAFVTEAEAP